MQLKKYSNHSDLKDSEGEVTSTLNKQKPPTKPLSPEPQALIHDEPSYDVQKILDHKDRPGESTLYLVKWKGFGPEENS